MLERIKNGVLAVGVCYPCYLLAYGTGYLLEPLLFPPEQHIAKTGLTVIAVMALVRMAWLFARAAVRGRPVFELPPEPVVTASVLGLGPVPARHETVGRTPAEPAGPDPQRARQPVETGLPAAALRG